MSDATPTARSVPLWGMFDLTLSEPSACNPFKPYQALLLRRIDGQGGDNGEQ
jgi:hypothetical protein